MKSYLIELIAAVLLFALGGQIEVEIPGSDVPFILTDFFVFFAALYLKPRDFAVSILLFLGFGAMGLPVFAGGSGGFTHLLGNTSGYLFGYLFGGLLVSMVSRKTDNSILKLLIVFSGYYLLFLLGILGIQFHNAIDIQSALMIGAVPFIFSMHLKAFLAWLLFIGVEKQSA